MFTEIEQEAIEEKLNQLRNVIDGSMSSKELADLITQRRVLWLEENINILNMKYRGLSDEEKAYRIIFLDHMRINPEYSEISSPSIGRIKIESYNFCPYLEACKILGLDTRHVCREIGEPSIQKVCELINPKLKFGRNYQKIRPYNPFFCEEYIELIR